MGHKRVAMIRANNRYGRVGVMEYADAATRLGHPFVMEERFNDGESSFTSQLERIKKVSPDAILIWGNAREEGIILRQLREMGMKQPVYTSDRAVNSEFLKNAGKYAEGIITTCQYNPDADNPQLRAFKANYYKRFGQEPDVFAAHAYDGMNIIIESIEKAGFKPCFNP